jgi:riboflavin-specific deaminase-like protein
MPNDPLFELYAPLVAAPRLVVGHLAQTLDGRIATLSGSSRYITGDENLVHAHRLRALCDVVLVGSRTVEADNPQLSTRLVDGPSPVRAVIDPQRRLDTHHHVFSDGAAPTLLFCTHEAATAARHGQAEVVPIPVDDGRLSVPAILAELSRRGLPRVFVEGGGVTMSRFLEAGALTRLHITVAPLLLGSGRPSLSLPVVEDIAKARPLRLRHYPMGRDLLFDCELV